MRNKGSRMFRHYLLRLSCRILILLIFVYFYLFARDRIAPLSEFRLFGPFTPLHLLWLILMSGMLLHLLPNARVTLCCRKSRAVDFQPQPDYDPAQLSAYRRLMNRRALRVALVWITCNAVPGILYLRQILGDAEMLLLTLPYFVGDLVCILIFCPFQTFFMRNCCCMDCRIFDWGHIMMHTPMLFVPGFFSRSLFITACLVFLHWELAFARHPERFWRGSNQAIRCENCREQLCRIKEPLRRTLGLPATEQRMPPARRNGNNA